MLQLPLRRRPLPNSSRGPLVPSRARHLSQARRDSEMTFQAWRVLAQTSQWSAHGKPSGTWSSVTWRNMELFSPPSFAFTFLATIVPCVVLILSDRPVIYYFHGLQMKQLLML